jgi:nucleotide-binding universal stress UspA family protein
MRRSLVATPMVGDTKGTYMVSRILVPLDGSEAAATVIPAVRQLVGGTGAVVYLLAARPLPRPSASYLTSSMNPEAMISASLFGAQPSMHDGSRSFEELMRREHATLDRYLARHGSQLAYDGIVVRRDVRFGDPMAEILAAAQQHATHLIMVAREPQGWRPRLQRLLRPTLAQQLLGHARLPVLVVPSEHAATQGVVLRYDRAAV